MSNDKGCEEYVVEHCTGYAVYEPLDESTSSDSSKPATQSSDAPVTKYDKQSTGLREGWNSWPYQIANKGTNSQGNRYESRDYGPNVPDRNAYRYSNNNGSYYYKNPDGSRYYNNGKGYSRFDGPELDDQTDHDAVQVNGDEASDGSSQAEDRGHLDYDENTGSDGEAEYGYHPEDDYQSNDDDQAEYDYEDDGYDCEDVYF
ncbi:hypothetical protein MBLNU457_4625t1 [Dothideomycetes sp. NU457]